MQYGYGLKVSLILEGVVERCGAGVRPRADIRPDYPDMHESIILTRRAGGLGMRLYTPDVYKDV